MQRPTPLVRRGEGVSQAAGTLPRATSPSTPGRKRRFLFLFFFLKKGRKAKQWLAPIEAGREAGGCREDRKFSYSSILSGNPQHCCGLVSPWPVWMKLFLSGWLMSWADSPATEVTVFRGNWPTFRVRLF